MLVCANHMFNYALAYVNSFFCLEILKWLVRGEVCCCDGVTVGTPVPVPTPCERLLGMAAARSRVAG